MFLNKSSPQTIADVRRRPNKPLMPGRRWRLDGFLPDVSGFKGNSRVKSLKLLHHLCVFFCSEHVIMALEKKQKENYHSMPLLFWGFWKSNLFIFSADFLSLRLYFIWVVGDLFERKLPSQKSSQMAKLKGRGVKVFQSKIPCLSSKVKLIKMGNYMQWSSLAMHFCSPFLKSWKLFWGR